MNNLFTSNNNNMFSGGGGGSNNLFNRGGNTGGGMGGNNLFQSNQGNNMGGGNNMGMSGNNLFNRSNTTGNNMMSNTGGNNMGGMGGNNLFNRSNTMGSGNNMMGGGSNNMFNSGGGHGYGTRSNTGNQSPFGNNMGGGSGMMNMGGGYGNQVGTVGVMQKTGKNKENLVVECITASEKCKSKALDELRLEDYFLMKNNQVPDNVKQIIQKNMSGGGMMSGGMNMGGMGNNNTSNSNMGGNNMFNSGGSSGNNLFNQQGGGSGNQSGLTLTRQNATMGGGNNMFSGNNMFNQQQQQQGNNMFNQQNQGGMSGNNLMQNRNNLFNQGGSSGGNNLFQSNNNMGGGGGNNLFNRQGTGNMGGGGNNLFQGNQQQQQQGGNNLFNRNQNSSIFPNQQNQQGGMMQQQGNNLFPNQQQSNNLFPQQQQGMMNQNPQLFPSGGNPSLFPNQYQQQQGYYPQQQQGYPGYYGYPQYQGGYPQPMMDPNYNPHLFPGQNPMYGYPNQQQQMYRGDYSLQSRGSFDYDRFQSGMYTPYQQEKKESTFIPRKNLNEIANNLNSRFFNDGRDRESYLPYNPFDKNPKKTEKIETQNFRSNSLLKTFTSHSLIRKTDESLYDNRRSYLDDDMEIILRPKLSESVFINNTRNRSSSPVSRSNGGLDISLASGRKNRKSIYDQSIDVNVTMGFQKTEIKKSGTLSIYKGIDVFNLKRKAIEIAREKGYIRVDPDQIDELAERADLFHNATSCSNERSIEEYGIGDNSVVLVEIDAPLAELMRNSDMYSSYNNNRTEQTQFRYPDDPPTTTVSKRAPKLTRPGYTTIPSMDKIRAMTDLELAMVEGFTIENENGTIEWEGKTDIRDLDLDKLVFIGEAAAEVYPDSVFTEEMKPRRGEKLNKPAIITLRKCYSQVKNVEKAKAKLREKVKNEGYELIDYDPANGVYKVRVLHFTKYEFNLDDEEEEEEVPPRGHLGQLSSPHFAVTRDEDSDDNAGFIQEIETSKGKGFQRPQRDSPGSFQNKLIRPSGNGSLSKNLGQIAEEQDFEESEIRGDEEEFDIESEESPIESHTQQFKKRHTLPGRKMFKTNDEQYQFGPDTEEAFDQEPFNEEVTSEKGEEEIIPETRFEDILSQARDVFAKGRRRLAFDTNIKLSKEAESRISALQVSNKVIFNDSRNALKDREFYMHRSFRVGWTHNGFVIPSIKKSIQIHKVVIHRGLGCSDEEQNDFEYSRYKAGLSYISRHIYKPFMEKLIDPNTELDLMMNNLSLNDSSIQKKVKVAFPNANQFVQAMIKYIEAYVHESLPSEAMGRYARDLFLRDLELFSLMNSLFGNYEIDLWNYALHWGKGEPQFSRSKLKQLLDKYEDGSYFKRKTAISKWFEKKTSQLVNNDILAARQARAEEERAYPEREEEIRERLLEDELLLHLSGRQINKASDEAKRYGMDRLAILISMASTNRNLKKMMEKQIQEWTKSNDIHYLTFRRVYEFLSGNINVVNQYDWYRIFALRFWYVHNPNEFVQDVFNQLFDELKNTNNVGPLLSEFSDKDPICQRFDFAYILIAMFSENKLFQPAKCFSPYTYSEDCFDVKYLWLADLYVSKYKQDVENKHKDIKNKDMIIESDLSDEEIEFKYRLLRAVCHQFELLGLWEFAVYAIQVASNQVISDRNKWRFIHELVLRNYQRAGTYSSEKHLGDKPLKRLLQENFKVPSKYLYESKAYRYMYHSSYKKAANSLTKAQLWKHAHSYVCNVLAPVLFCNLIAQNNHDSSRQLLVYLESKLISIEQGKVPAWEREGMVLKRFADILLSEDKYVEDQDACDKIMSVITDMEKFEKNKGDSFKKIMVGKMYKELSRLLVKALPPRPPKALFEKYQDKLGSCIEKCQTGFKDDNTPITLSYVEKEALI